MSDDKKQSSAAKKAADAKAAKSAKAAEQKSIAGAVEQPVKTVESTVNESVAAPKEEHEEVLVIAVEVRSTLERRCRAGYVFGLEPVRIEGDALDTLDYGALEADPYLHVEYITGTGDA